MKLRSKVFEKRLSRLLRQELIASPALKAEFKKHSRKLTTNIGIPSWLLKIIYGGLFFSVVSDTGGTHIALAAIALWSMGLVFSLATHWLEVCFAEPDISVLKLLPYTDRQVFLAQNRRFFLESRGIFQWMVVLYAAVFGISKTPADWPWLLVCAILQISFIIALAFVVARYLYRFPIGLLSFSFKAAAVGLILLGGFDAVVLNIIPIFPSAWLHMAFLQNSAPSFTYFLPLILVGTFYLARRSWLWFRTHYSLSQVSSAFEWETNALDGTSVIGVTEAADVISSRDFLARPSWINKKFFENLANRILTDSERKTAEFLSLDNLNWTAGFKKTFYIWLICSSLTAFFGHWGPVFLLFTGFLFLSSYFLLQAADWPGLQGAELGLVKVPVYALYPLKFSTIIKVLIKLNLLRIWILSPLLVSLSAISCVAFKMTFLSGALLGLKLLLIVTTLIPLLVLIPISGNTNDTARAGFWHLLLFLAGNLLALIASGIVIFAPNFSVAVVCLLANFLISSALCILYTRAYNHCRFDLHTRPAAPQQPD